MNMKEFAKLGYIAAQTKLHVRDVESVLRYAKEYEKVKADYVTINVSLKEEADIEKIARELNDLVKKEQRTLGIDWYNKGGNVVR